MVRSKVKLPDHQRLPISQDVDANFFTCSLLTLTLLTSILTIWVLIRKNHDSKSKQRLKRKKVVYGQFHKWPLRSNILFKNKPEDELLSTCATIQPTTTSPLQHSQTQAKLTGEAIVNNSLPHLNRPENPNHRRSNASIGIQDPPELKRCVSFSQQVSVICIEKAAEYSPTERLASWPSPDEAEESLLRNTIESEAEMKNGRVLEEEEMILCEGSGELVHPAFVEFLLNHTDLQVN